MSFFFYAFLALPALPLTLIALSAVYGNHTLASRRVVMNANRGQYPR